MNKLVENFTHINVSFDVIHKISEKEVNNHVLGVIMAQQFSLKSGFKKWRQQERSCHRGIEAAL